MRIVILGASGSIGQSTLDVIRAFPDRLELVGVSVHTNVDAAQTIVREFPSCERVGITGIEKQEGLSILGVRVYWGKESLVEMVNESRADVVVFAMPGGGVVDVLLDLLDLGVEVAMANKEALVMAHDLVRPGIERGIRPIDSEQSGLWQVIPKDPEELEEVILTCSGGPFLGRKREDLRGVSPQEAIKHPRWDMGPKVSLDSATLMNKALEMIETSALFGIGEEKISVLVHPQALVHAMIRFKDGSILSQVGPTDMRFPIQYALSYPERWDCPRDGLNLEGVKMEFFLPDEETFTSLQTARLAMRKGGSALVVFNVANDLLGENFFAGKIGFLDIMDISRQLIEEHEPWSISSREDIERAVQWTRETLYGLL